MFGWRLIRVVGPSMEPTLRNGQIWGASFGSIHPGSLVVLREPDRPGMLSVKRVISREQDGWWVEGDNADESRDSRHYGVVPTDTIVALLRFRLR